MYAQHRISISSARKVDFDEVWERLLQTVTGVITCGEVARSTWADRIGDVYKLCTALPNPFSERLYLETRNYLETYVKETKLEVKEDEDYLLDVYQERWQKYYRGALYLNQLYGYLNITFIRKNKFNDGEVNDAGLTVGTDYDYMEIGELALDIWKKHMIEPLKFRLQALLLQEIADHRQHDPVNKESVVRGVIFSLVEVMKYKKKLQLYDEMFEAPLVKETRNYYRSVAKQLKGDCTLSEYMEKVIQLLSEEEERCRKFLHPSSFDTIMQECEELLAEDHFWYLISESHEMVKRENKKDMKNLFYLLNLVDRGLGVLQRDVEQHIKQTLTDALRRLKTDNMPARFVEAVLRNHSYFTDLIRIVFDNNELFMEALEKGVAAAINARMDTEVPCPSPQLLAQCCNIWLKKSTEVSSEEERENRLEQCVMLHKYLEDKETFKLVYSHLLAERLVNEECVSKKTEETMINKLKVVNCLRLIHTPRDLLQRRLSESPGNLTPQKPRSVQYGQMRRVARTMQHSLLFSYKQSCFCGKRKCTSNCKPGGKKAERERKLTEAVAGMGLVRQNSDPVDSADGKPRHNSEPMTPMIREEMMDVGTSVDGGTVVEGGTAVEAENGEGMTRHSSLPSLTVPAEVADSYDVRNDI